MIILAPAMTDLLVMVKQSETQEQNAPNVAIILLFKWNLRLESMFVSVTMVGLQLLIH